MKRIIFILASLLLFTLSSSEAALYKGQRAYAKVCIKCHTDREAFISSFNKRTWKKYMRKKGKKLAAVHLKSSKFKKAKKYSKYKKYFKSRKYAKTAKHLKQFLVEYAKDSGNVPACN